MHRQREIVREIEGEGTFKYEFQFILDARLRRTCLRVAPQGQKPRRHTYTHTHKYTQRSTV